MGRVTFVCLLFSVAVIASDGQVSNTTRMDGYPDVGAPPIVKLLSPGSAPRRDLRLSIVSSQKEQVCITLAYTYPNGFVTIFGWQGSEPPPQPMRTDTYNITCDLSVTQVATNGDISYTVVFNTATRAAGEVRDDWMTPTNWTATVSTRGVVLALDMVQGWAGSTRLHAPLPIESGPIVLPEDEIGVGARWDVHETIVRSGHPVFQQREYELVGSHGKESTLAVRTAETVPAGRTSASGSGVQIIRPDRLVPIGTIRMDRVQTTELVRHDGSTTETKMKTSTTVTTTAK